MERLWSLAGATSGNRWQMERPRKRLKEAKSAAVGCDQLPRECHGKEGVDGSSPSEGFNYEKIPANGDFCCLIQHHRALPPHRRDRSQVVATPQMAANRPLARYNGALPCSVSAPWEARPGEDEARHRADQVFAALGPVPCGNAGYVEWSAAPPAPFSSVCSQLGSARTGRRAAPVRPPSRARSGPSRGSRGRRGRGCPDAGHARAARRRPDRSRAARAPALPSSWARGSPIG